MKTSTGNSGVICGREKLELTAIADRALRQTWAFGPGLEYRSHFFGAHESAADISIFRTGIERDEPIAVLAIGLEPVADFLRPLPEYLRAFGASSIMKNSLNSMQQFCFRSFKGLFKGLLKR